MKEEHMDEKNLQKKLFLNLERTKNLVPGAKQIKENFDEKFKFLQNMDENIESSLIEIIQEQDKKKDN